MVTTRRERSLRKLLVNGRLAEASDIEPMIFLTAPKGLHLVLTDEEVNRLGGLALIRRHYPKATIEIGQ